MGSVGNQNPWAPYDNYRDCSQGICSTYCPQFCYLIFPPPPSDDDSGSPFSPLIIAIIGVLASAFLLVSYYTVVTRYCRGRNDQNLGLENEENRDESSQDQWQIAPSGLDEAFIKTITVCKYKKGDGLIEGTECAVCLSEFQENESLRLLPKCSHAFHLPCIDTWLKSQSNCPLCRATVIVLAHPVPSPQTSVAVNMNSYEIQRPDDLVLVVDNQEQMVVSLVSDDHVPPKSPIQEDLELRNESIGSDHEGVEKFRRSVSSGMVSSQRQLLISDILKFEEIDEYMQLESDNLWRGIGSSRGFSVEESKSSGDSLLRSPVAMKRSTSTGRFMFTVPDKGKNSILPN
ncbi:Anaphase-promoting complex (APC), subunit 11 [Handroanthus impetiginosus]|uniref:RING-type E3 ubiquitin transferase n=1 Tax=Handroanthus impetiginosus TaxID=429701 RepID=A0A2G9FYH8_9LAMI|nr:Anaphase-promoting complex (APC), subunit 11 [Handroanthus impetiginosus]